jgi:DNA-binding MarR family transcriptional regulator
MSQQLQRDLHMQNPASPNNTVFLSLVVTANRLQDAVRKKLRPHGLQMGPYNVLRILRGAGSEGLSCGAISDRLLDPTPDVTRLLARLETKGYVRRERDSDDKRSIKAVITEAGVAALAPLDSELETLMSQMVGHLDEASRQHLIAGCDLIRHPDTTSADT